MTEEKLAAGVVEWLRAQHWEVYQEVECRGSVCDIVATSGPLVWAIECKTSFGLAVLSQAFSWRPHAHFVSIAVPHRRWRTRAFAVQAMRDYGIGSVIGGGYGGAQEDIEPRLNRHADRRLRDALREEHKTWAAAGNARGDRFTPFQATVREARAFVAAHPGATFREMVAAIRHHYRSAATARSCLKRYIEAGIVEGIDLRRDGRALRVYPSEAAA